MADEPKTYTQADIDKLMESVDKLETKNAEIVADLRKAQAKARAASEITPEALQAEIDAHEATKSALAEATKALKAATTDRDKAVKALETEQNAGRASILDSEVSTLIAKHGVVPEAFEMVQSFLRNGASVELVDGKLVSRRGDKTLADFAEEYFASDAAKIVKPAANNSGGGAPGGKGNAGAVKQMTRAEFNALGGENGGTTPAQTAAGQAAAKGELIIND